MGNGLIIQLFKTMGDKLTRKKNGGTKMMKRFVIKILIALFLVVTSAPITFALGDHINTHTNSNVIDFGTNGAESQFLNNGLIVENTQNIKNIVTHDTNTRHFNILGEPGLTNSIHTTTTVVDGVIKEEHIRIRP